MKKCRVSVILPSLNVAKYIDECLRSVSDQTLHEIEILCVDAGSTDGTLEIIKKYQSSDSRVQLIQSERKSYGYQVNLGIEEAIGEYIAILETDDYVDTDMYETLYMLAEQTNCDYVKGNFRSYYTYQNGKRVFIPSDVLASSGEEYESIIDIQKCAKLIQHDTNVWSGIYKKDFLNKYNIRCNESRGAAFQDIGFLQKVFWYAHSGYYTKRCFYNYCIDRESSSTNNGNNLRYAYQEYLALLSDYSNDKDIQNWDIVYERMSDVFEENTRKTLLQGRESENSEIIEWFATILVNKYNEGIISRLYLKEIDAGLPEWLDKVQKQICAQEEQKDYFFKTIGNSQVVIFGAGIRGKRLLQQIGKYDIKVNAFCDNNSSIWGNNIAGITIYGLDTIFIKYPNAKYIIANKYHYIEIRQQLLNKGIAEDGIVVFEESKGWNV